MNDNTMVTVYLTNGDEIIGSAGSNLTKDFMVKSKKDGVFVLTTTVKNQIGGLRLCKKFINFDNITYVEIIEERAR